MTNDGEYVLYYAFKFTVGTHPERGGIWHFVTVNRVTPDGEVFVDRIRAYTRRGAKRAAKSAAKADLKWIEANTKDETMVWRP